MNKCEKCGKEMPWGKGKCIDCLLAAVPWKAGDTVKVKSTGKKGKVLYRYYNGFTLLDTGTPIKGGIFDNNSTYSNSELSLVKRNRFLAGV